MDQNDKKSPKNDPAGSMMYVACSRCRQIIDVRPGNLGSITHTLCPECLQATLQEIDDFKKTAQISPFPPGSGQGRP